ncbi:hypothetical protein ACGFZK_21280 [Streptomyces sp. NPDC048257]|uniref:hypothetical protein n=1 Tax=Streptomyces sp. NPDC048257 TaxID=3365526 RepID=UPI003716B81C
MADEGESEAIGLRDDLDRAIAHNNIAACRTSSASWWQGAHAATADREAGARGAGAHLPRHLCAHPAFVAVGEELFNPTAELVRAHLAAAVDALIAKIRVTGLGEGKGYATRMTLRAMRGYETFSWGTTPQSHEGKRFFSL